MDWVVDKSFILPYPSGDGDAFVERLLHIKQNLGFVDPRYGLKECELCDNAEWRPGVTCAVPPKETPTLSGTSASW